MLVRPKGGGVETAFGAFGKQLREAGLTRTATAGPLMLECGDMQPIFKFTQAALDEDINCLVTLS